MRWPGFLPCGSVRPGNLSHRLLAEVQRRDAEGERVPADVPQPVTAQALRERLAVGKLQDALGQVAMRLVAAARDPLADTRQDVAEVETVEPAEQPAPRLRELEDRHPPAGLCH